MLKYQICAQSKTGKIFIYGVIGEKENSSKELVKVINEMESKGVKDYQIFINSPGGLVYDGLAIYNHIKGLNAEVIIDAQAASIASVIALAGAKVSMYKNCTFMIHNPMTMAWGNQNDFKKVQDNLEHVRDLIMSAYTSKTGKSENQIKQWMDDETWFNADQALEAGFIDNIIDKESPVKNTENSFQEFYNLITKPKQSEGIMNLKTQLIALLVLAAAATEEAIMTAVTKLKEAADKVPGLEDMVADYKAKLTTAETEAATVKAELKNSNKALAEKTLELLNSTANLALDKIVNAGKILPAQREDYLEEALKDPVAFEAKFKDRPQVFDLKDGLPIQPGNTDTGNLQEDATNHIKAQMQGV